MGIRVLGPLTVDGSGRLGPHDRVVVQALAARLGQPVSADELIDAVWGEHPPASAAKNLQSCIVKLRKVLGPDAIETTTHGYVLALRADGLDAAEFEAQVTRARELLAAGESDRVAYLLERALALWRGSAFQDLPDWSPGRREAGRLEELRLEAQEMRVDAMLRSGRPREVLAEAHTLVRAAPLRERRWELLVLAQYQTGAQGEALRSLRQLRAVLARELGIDPSPEMVALEQSILAQDPSLVVPQPRAAMSTCPWQGLKAYDVDDADRFFGRDRDVQSCLDLLAASSFAALVGPSGSGKSSIMRAGVLAALHERGHPIVLVTPTASPMDALTALPPDADTRTVLAVDQTEEVFTLCEDPDERRAFLDRLTQEAARRPVVVTMRGDRLTQVTAHPGFSQLVERSLHLVGALDDDALRASITGPAQMAGLVLQPGLADLLVREVRDDPGALPLLSHALQETWRRREGNTLTVDGYHASGGINGAVAQSAEQLYGGIPADQRHLLRDLLLRLVSAGAEGEAVRTQVPRRLIASDGHHEQLISMLVDARLVTSDEGVLEITHEALARAWPRLRGWLDDDVEGQRTRHHLSGAADAWDTLDRPDSELYRGIRLARALEWESRTATTLTDVEHEFLDAGRAASEAEAQSAAERARVQARMIRRLRIVLGGALVLLVLALAAGGLAVVQSERADDNAARALQAAVSADARRVGARSQLVDDISLSMLLAVAGARLDDSPETRANLVTALAERPLLVRSAPPGGGFMESLEASPDGRWIAASDDQNRMHLYDAATNQLLDTYDAGLPDGADQAWMFSAFSPDSERLAVIPEGGQPISQVLLLDPSTMEPATELELPRGRRSWGVDVTFSGDGRYVAASVMASDWIVPDSSKIPSYGVVWDLRSPSSPPAWVPVGTEVQGLALSRDGRTLYTGHPLTAYDVASGRRIWQRSDVNTPYFSLDVNSEGTLLALSMEEPGGCVRDGLLVKTTDGATKRRLRSRGPTCETRFSPDGTLVGSISTRGEVMVWQTATGRLLERWQTFDPQGIAFGPHNGLVHAGGRDSMLRAWDLSAQDTYVQETLAVGGPPVFAHADLSPDGRKVAYRWVDAHERGWVRFVDVVSGATTPPTRVPTQEAPWAFGAWRPDGGQYVAWCVSEAGTCVEHGVVTLLDTATGRAVHEPRDIIDGNGDIHGVTFIDEGRSLLVGSSERQTVVLDAETLRPREGPFDYGADSAVTIGDGSTAAVSDVLGDGTFEHWRWIDVSSGAVQSEWDASMAYATAARPDGSTLAVAGFAGEIVTFDVGSGAVQHRSTSIGAPVRWLNYSEDGGLLVSGAADGGVSLWDAETLELMGTVHPPHRSNAVPAAAQFIGDTHDVVIASYDGSIFRWDTSLDRALDFACQMAGRDLTEEEWAQVLPAQPYQSVCPQE